MAIHIDSGDGVTGVCSAVLPPAPAAATVTVTRAFSECDCTDCLWVSWGILNKHTVECTARLHFLTARAEARVTVINPVRRGSR